MPLIEFLCPNNHVIEKLLNRQEADGTQCIPCAQCQEIAERIISTTSMLFFGEGFYKESLSSPKVVNPDRVMFDGPGHVQTD